MISSSFTVGIRSFCQTCGLIDSGAAVPSCVPRKRNAGPLPAMTLDHRDIVEALVHKDLRLSFDGNRYCVPPRYVGRRLTVKADSSSVTIYDQHQEIVRYPRCWRRGQTFGAERFERELFVRMAAAQRSAAQHRVVALLGPASEEYLRQLAHTDRSLTRQVRELLTLIRDYGPNAVAAAIEKAHAARAFVTLTAGGAV